jgi:hypothetical protein
VWAMDGGWLTPDALSEVMSDRCPVCDEDLGFQAWSGGKASFEICPGCGIHFGYNDARPDLRELIHAAWREKWLANGRKPFDGEAWRQASERVIARVQSRTAPRQ